VKTYCLKSPFPYFGGKSKVAETVWSRFGNVENYVEPFFGSGAVLLLRPAEAGKETVNDADGLLANFWRALRAKPDEVAYHSDWPVSENDLHARHAWLVERKGSLQAKLEGDPDYFDVKAAGWWVWGMACWIGSGFCSGKGPWQVQEVDGVRQLVHLGSNGQGVNRQLVHLGSNGQGVKRKLVHLGDKSRGVNRKLVRLSGHSETGVNAREDLVLYFEELAARLRDVRVCCGDWSRVCGPSVTHKHGMTAVFLDPPYADTASRADNLYRIDCNKVAHAVREWAIEEGKSPLMRIALCGYEDEHQMPESWECLHWKQNEGFASQAKERSNNNRRERIWFSPNCVKAMQRSLL
jgi:site-specific DNA-adenine methylase